MNRMFSLNKQAQLIRNAESIFFFVLHFFLSLYTHIRHTFCTYFLLVLLASCLVYSHCSYFYFYFIALGLTWCSSLYF